MWEFLTCSGAVFVLKLACSVDDLVWLPWLLAGRPEASRRLIHITYLTTVLAIAFASVLAARFGVDLVVAIGLDADWLAGGIGALLLGFGVLEWREQVHEGAGGLTRPDEPRSDAVDAPSGMPHDRRLAERAGVQLALHVGAVTVLGSLDEFGAFAMAVAAMDLSLGSILLGTVFGSYAVLWMAQISTRNRGVTRALLRVPEWAFLIAMGLSGLLMGLRNSFF